MKARHRRFAWIAAGLAAIAVAVALWRVRAIILERERGSAWIEGRPGMARA
jgi:hypothetical protein